MIHSALGEKGGLREAGRNVKQKREIEGSAQQERKWEGAGAGERMGSQRQGRRYGVRVLFWVGLEHE